MSEIAFNAMGSRIRIVAEAALAPAAPAERVLAGARAWTEDFARRLSRFVPDSELSRLNADPRAVVPASPLLRAAVGAGLWAAETTDGLVDPTLVGALEDTGYTSSRADVDPARLIDALAAAPARRPARPHPGACWRAVEVRDHERAIARPRGVRLDTGGTGKGLAADALLTRLAGFGRVAVDCGGDVRIGGPLAADCPFQVDVQHPFSGGVVMSLAVGAGGVATSGIDVNLWRRGDGSFAHHLLDPSTGEPAWTGLVAATALAPTALEAETLAKAALLGGPAGARQVLAQHGGLMFADDGSVQAVGPLDQVDPVAA